MHLVYTASHAGGPHCGAKAQEAAQLFSHDKIVLSVAPSAARAPMDISARPARGAGATCCLLSQHRPPILVLTDRQLQGLPGTLARVFVLCACSAPVQQNLMKSNLPLTQWSIDSVVNSNSVRMTVLTTTSPAENIFACSPLQAAFFRVDPILVTVTPGQTLSDKCARVSGALTHPGLLHPELESPGRHIWNEASDYGDLCVVPSCQVSCIDCARPCRL